MKFSRQEEIAVLAVTQIAQNFPTWVSVTDITREHGLSPLFLKKILRLLRSSNIVESKEGIGGGYALAREPEKISVYDVFHAVSGSVLTPPNQSGVSAMCPLSKNCMPHKVRSVIGTALSTYLSDITINQLVGKDKE